MAKYRTEMTYNISTRYDNKGLKQFQRELSDIRKGIKTVTDAQLLAQSQINTLGKEMSKSFSTRTGMYDVSKLSKNLQESRFNVQRLADAGARGDQALLSSVRQVAKLNTEFKSSAKWSDKIMNTIGNTVRWRITAGATETIANSIQRAAAQAIELDTALNNIRVVTGRSNAEMEGFARNAANIAKTLGTSMVDVSNASMVFAENGFSEKDFTRLGALSSKVAMVTHQTTDQVSDEITAMMNGMKLSVDEVEPALDKMALVAAEGASDLGELAEAQQKVASTANMLGVSQDQLIAQLSTIISVTRQAPEAVGNSLKTIYARMGDLKLGNTINEDGVEVNLGKVSGSLQKLGIDILDDNGNLKQMGDLLEELMSKWQGLTDAQRQAAAVELAGKHQYNNLVALLDNQTMYNKQLDLTANAAGTVEKQHAIAMDKIESKQKVLRASTEEFYQTLFDEETAKGFLDVVTKIVNVLTKVTDIVGGGAGFDKMLLPLAGLVLQKGANSLSASSMDRFEQDFQAKQVQQQWSQTHRHFENEIQDMPGYHPQLLQASRELNNLNQYIPNATDQQLKDLDAAQQMGLTSLTESAQRMAETEQRINESSNSPFKNGFMTVGGKRQSDFTFSQMTDKDWDNFKKMREDLNPNKLIDNQKFADFVTGRSFSDDNGKRSLPGFDGTSRSRRSSAKILNQGIALTADGDFLDWNDRLLEAQSDGVQEQLKTLQDVKSKGYAGLLTKGQQKAIESFANNAEGNEAAIEKLFNELQDMVTSAVDLAEEARGTKESMQQGSQALREKNNADENVSNVQENIDSVTKNIERQNILQKKYEGAGLAASAMGIGAFAGGGTAEALGRLVQGDIGGGFGQLVGTGAMAIPSYLSVKRQALQNSQETLDILMKNRGLSDEQQKALSKSSSLDKAKWIKEAAKSEKLDRIAETGKTASTNIGAQFQEVKAGASGVASALSTLTPYITAATIAFQVIAGAIKAYNEAREARIKKAREGLEEHGGNVQKLGQLQEQFKDIETITPEVAEQMRDIAKQFKLVGVESDIAANNLDNFVQKMKNAQIQEADRAIKEASIIRKENQDNGILSLLGARNLFNTGGDETKAEMGIDQKMNRGVFSKTNVESSDSFLAKVQKLEEEREAYEKKGQDLLDKEIITEKQYQDTLNRYAKVLDTKESQQAQLDDLNLRQAIVAKDKAENSSRQMSGLSAGDTLRTMNKDSNIKKILDDMAYDSNRFEFILKNYRDSMDNATARALETATQLDKLKRADWENDNVKNRFYSKDFTDRDRELLLLDAKIDVSKLQNTEELDTALENIRATKLLEIPVTLGVEDIKNASQNKNQLGGLIDKYNQTSNGFSQDEAASILSENPDYAQYLVKVGDTYRLNEKAAADYAQTVRDLNLAMDESQGRHWDNSIVNGQLNSLKGDNFQESIGEGEESDGSDKWSGQLDGTISKLQQLSYEFNNSKISAQDFASSTINTFEDLTDVIGESSESFHDFAQTEIGTNMVVSFAQEAEGAIQTLFNQFNSGQIGIDTVTKSLKSSEDGLRAMAKACDGTSSQLDSLFNELDKVSEASEFMTEHYDELSQIFDDSGVVLDEMQNAAGGMAESARTVVADLANVGQQFLTDNIEGQRILLETLEANGVAAGETAQNIVNDIVAGGQTGMNTLMNSAAATSALTQAIGKQTQSSIGKITSAITLLLMKMMHNVSNSKADFKTSVKENGAHKVNITGKDGEGKSVDGGFLMLPSFTYSMSGSGSTGIQEVDDYFGGNSGKGDGSWVDTPDSNGHGNTRLGPNGETYAGKPAQTAEQAKTAAFNAAMEAIGREYSLEIGAVSDAAGSISMGKLWGGGKGVPQGSFGRPSGHKGGGGGRGGGGRGGGGRGGKAEKPEDPMEYDYDRYKEVEGHLKQIANTLSKIQKLTDRLTGDEYLKNIAKQNELLKAQIPYLKEKLALQMQELKEEQEKLIDLGLKFDDEGYITNREEVYDSLFNRINQLKQKPETNKDALKQANKEMQRLKKSSSDYYKIFTDGVLKTTQALQDIDIQLEDLSISVFKKQTTAGKNLKDISEAYIDFKSGMKHFGDTDSPVRDMENAAEKAKLYWDINSEGMNDYYSQLIKQMKEAEAVGDKDKAAWFKSRADMYEKAQQQQGAGTFELGGTGLFDMASTNMLDMLEQIHQFESAGTSTIFGKNSQVMYDMANDIYQEAIDVFQEFEDNYENLHQAILSGIDELGEKLDRRLSEFEEVDNRLEHWANLTTLINGEDAYEQLNKITDAQIHNAQASIADMKKGITVYQDLLDKIEATSGKESEQWKNVHDKIVEQQENLLSKVDDTAQKIMDKYNRLATVLIKQQFEIPGMGDLDWAAQQWELINRNADQYLDSVNKAYNIQKLQNRYVDMLNNAQDPLIQQRITEQMNTQLDYMKDKTKLSQYDVAYANAQLEILQKRIALEEAERNKSQMKLQRDTQGNYSYEYVANRDDITKAQGDLLDASNNAYNLTKNNIVTIQNDAIGAVQAAKQAMIEIWTNANLTIEEKQERTRFLAKNLQEYLQGSQEQLSESQINIVNDFVDMAHLTVETAGEDMTSLLEAIESGQDFQMSQIDERFNDTILNWIQGFTGTESELNSLQDRLTQNWEEAASSFESIGISIKDGVVEIEDAIQGCVDKTDSLTDSSHKFFEQLKADSGTIKEYNEDLGKMAQKIVDAENNMKLYANQVAGLKKKLSSMESKNKDLSSRLEAAKEKQKSSSSSGSSGSSSGGGHSRPSLGAGSRVQIKPGYRWYYTARGRNPSGWPRQHLPGGWGYIRRTASGAKPYSISRTSGGADLGWVEKRAIVGYKSGGYTGNWSSKSGDPTGQNGKLAWLHQKELILNESDTANILQAVKSVRAMTEQLRNGTYENALQTVGNLSMDKMFNEREVKQDVKIDASFPDVHDARSVEQALLGLVDKASQYAFKEDV